MGPVCVWRGVSWLHCAYEHVLVEIWEVFKMPFKNAKNKNKKAQFERNFLKSTTHTLNHFIGTFMEKKCKKNQYVSHNNAIFLDVKASTAQ